MIYCVWGLPGAGKSSYATKKVFQNLKKGRRVLSNIHSTSGLWDFASWEQMQRATNALCLVDEAHMWFSSRAWQKQGVDDLGTFMQSRKSGLDLMMVVQHPNRLDVAIREVVHYYIHCTKMLGFHRARWHDWGSEKQKTIKTEFFMPSAKHFDSYFTEEIVGHRDGKGNRLGLGDAYSQLLYRATWPDGRVSWGNSDIFAISCAGRGAEVVPYVKRRLSGALLRVPETLQVIDSVLEWRRVRNNDLRAS